MTQTADASAVTNQLTSVYVVGASSDQLPGELYYAGRGKIFEDRYQTVFNNIINCDAFSSNYSIQWTRLPTQQFTRIRGDCVYMQFTWPAFAASADGLFGTAAVTPLPALGITYFDQILLNFGTNAAPVYTQVTNQDIPFMMKYFGFMKKNEAAMPYFFTLAGLFPYTSFDYFGGVDAGGTFANYAQLNVNPTVANGIVTQPFCGNAGQINLASLLRPACPQVFATQQAIYANAGALPSNVNGGLWVDPAMQKYRQLFFTSGHGVQQNSYLTKLSLISECFDTPVAYPPIQYKSEFRWPTSQAVRPRFINTPYVVPQANGAANITVDTALAAGAYAGPSVVNNQSFYLTQTLQFRPDIQSAMIFAWAQNSGFVDYFIHYDWWEQSNLTANVQNFNIVQQGNAMGYKAITGFQIAYPYQNMANGAVNPLVHQQLSRYTWGNCRQINMRAYVSSPLNLTTEDLMWNTGNANPNSWDSAYYQANTQRGSLDGFMDWWQTNYDTSFYNEPSFEDLSYKHWATDGYRLLQMPPQGSCTTAGATAYGSHAAYLAGQTGGFNIGPHNQLQSWFYAPPGFDNEHEDFGMFVGSLRMNINWATPIPSALQFHHLMAYENSITLIGTGAVALFVPIR